MARRYEACNRVMRCCRQFDPLPPLILTWFEERLNSCCRSAGECTSAIKKITVIVSLSKVLRYHAAGSCGLASSRSAAIFRDKI